MIELLMGVWCNNNRPLSTVSPSDIHRPILVKLDTTVLQSKSNNAESAKECLSSFLTIVSPVEKKKKKEKERLFP